MEKRITTKVDTHCSDFKKSIKSYFESKNAKVMSNGNDITSDALKYIYDYNNVELKKEDFQKRKRVKNVVPHCDRCFARRANGEQCTRRRNPDAKFCGTHAKGTPHGVLVSDDDNAIASVKSVEVWVEEIKGINYYIDGENNVYLHEHVLNNHPNPDIIAKWEMTPGGDYSIPEWGI